MPEPTIAQELREAAKRLRADASWPSEDLCLATAEWLDEAAADYERYDAGTQAFKAGGGRVGGDVDPAVKVARAVPSAGDPG